jgi:hypothetical protein
VIYRRPADRPPNLWFANRRFAPTWFWHKQKIRKNGLLTQFKILAKKLPTLSAIARYDLRRRLSPPFHKLRVNSGSFKTGRVLKKPFRFTNRERGAGRYKDVGLFQNAQSDSFGTATLDLIEKSGFRPLFWKPVPTLTRTQFAERSSCFGINSHYK